MVVAHWKPKEVPVSGVDDVHVSVVIEEPAGDSIFVEFSEMDSGESARFELRRRAVGGNESLEEVSVVFDDE